MWGHFNRFILIGFVCLFPGQQVNWFLGFAAVAAADLLYPRDYSTRGCLREARRACRASRSLVKLN